MVSPYWQEKRQMAFQAVRQAHFRKIVCPHRENKVGLNVCAKLRCLTHDVSVYIRSKDNQTDGEIFEVCFHTFAKSLIRWLLSR